ncbi:MAG: hypothetical protein FWD18_02625 [Micrococcales bacterium]|nr:hypothetical protein [Micrococcales bacterium]
MTRLLRRRLAGDDRARDDRGMGLVMVIAVAAIMATLLIAGTAVALNSQQHGARTADWDAARAAAYAGVEEYRSRVTSDSTYWRYGNPAAPFTVLSGSAATVTMPPTENPALGLGPGGTWAEVQGSEGVARFRYEVDTSTYLRNGLIRVRSTGLVGQHTRSVVASITQEGFIKFLYWTDYEVSSLTVAQATCRNNNWDNTLNRLKYFYEGRNETQCPPIQFASRDIIDGPLYSNDHLRICGAQFNDVVFTMTTMNPKFVTPAGCGAPRFAVAGSPQTPDARVDLPPTNAEMKRETRYDLPIDVPNPGCLYTGPTSIRFTADGYMQVRSPWTKFTQVAGTGATSGRNDASRCGTPGTAPGQLGSPDGARVPVIEGSLAFVQDVPSSTTDVNYTAQTAANKQALCGASNESMNGIGYPVANEVAAIGTYGCTVGDVFVSGVLNGHTTVAAEKNVWVVDNLTYAEGDAILGLVGQSSVTVWHPVRAGNANLLPNHDRTIRAAILSVTGTFTVQNYEHGVPIGTLYVYGSIAQKYRGPVGTGYADGTQVSGYDKAYHYDARFQTISPPKFLKTTITTFLASQFAEVPAAFDADGNAR